MAGVAGGAKLAVVKFYNLTVMASTGMGGAPARRSLGAGGKPRIVSPGGIGALGKII